MPDYVAIVKRSVEALPENTQTARATVYERARAALSRQLSAVKPELPQSAIDSQRQSLEDAISEVETEQRGENPQPSAPAVSPPAEAPSAPPISSSPPPISPAPPAPQTTSDAQPGSSGPVRPAAPMPPQATPASSQPAAASSPGQTSVGTPMAQPVPPPPPSPQTAPTANSGADNGQPSDPGAERQRYFGAGPQTPAPGAEKEKAARSSRAPFLIILVLIGLVGLGVAAVAYMQWPMIAGLFGGTSTEEQVAAESQDAEPETASTDQTADQGTTQPTDQTQGGAPDVRVVTPEDPNQGDQTTELQRPVGAEEAPADDASTPTDQAEGVLVGQRAIFYEQGDGDDAGSAVEGGVSWQPVPQPDGLDAIQATIDLPARQSQATITIKKNTDDGLPASHLIEISFNNVQALSNGLIDRIPALVLKPSEQERGQPLVGAAVPVTESLFWIALSDEGDQVTRNAALMREGSWFDVPILFDGGQRALLTFEKGVAGDQVFETVMSEWAQ